MDVFDLAIPDCPRRRTPVIALSRQILDARLRTIAQRCAELRDAEPRGGADADGAEPPQQQQHALAAPLLRVVKYTCEDLACTAREAGACPCALSAADAQRALGGLLKLASAVTAAPRPDFGAAAAVLGDLQGWLATGGREEETGAAGPPPPHAACAGAPADLHVRVTARAPRTLDRARP